MNQPKVAVLMVGALLGVSAHAWEYDVVLDTVQDEMPQNPKVSEATEEANKKLVWNFYRRPKVDGRTDWSYATMSQWFHDDFIQHDECEPSGLRNYIAMFGGGGPAGASGGMNAGPGAGMGAGGAAAPGATAATNGAASPDLVGYHDLKGQGYVRSIVADGELVVVIRDLQRPWPNGPAPWMKTTFVDIWRVVDGKIKEQWASVTPGDGMSDPVLGCKNFHAEPYAVPVKSEPEVVKNPPWLNKIGK